MSLVRRFVSLASFSGFIEQQRAVVVPVKALAIGATANILHRKTRAMYGSHVLPDLAPATQAERASLGYAPNDPLLRDGALLRDSVEQEVGPDYAAVGSAEVVAMYHEFGYHNKRTGTDVPPRPVYRLALEEAAPEVMSVLEALAGVQLGFSLISGVAPMLSGVASSASHEALISDLP